MLSVNRCHDICEQKNATLVPSGRDRSSKLGGGSRHVASLSEIPFAKVCAHDSDCRFLWCHIACTGLCTRSLLPHSPGDLHWCSNLVRMVLVVTCIRVNNSSSQLERTEQLTQMEVVVLSVADKHQASDQVHEGYALISRPSLLYHRCKEDNIRIIDGFLPIYLNEYHCKKPLGFCSGAAPRGSFS